MRLGISFIYYILNNVGFRLLRFLCLIVCARLLTLEDFGLFSTLFSCVSIFGAISVLGMHNTVVKFGEESVRGGAKPFRRLLKLSFGINIVLGLLFAWLIFALRDTMLLKLDVPVTPLLIGAATIAPWAVGRTMTFVFRALREPKKSVVLDIAGPTCFLAALGFLAMTGASSLSNIMMGHLLGMIAPLLIGFFLLAGFTRKLPEASVRTEQAGLSTIISFSLFTTIATVSTLSGSEMDRLLLAWLLDPQSVGQYNAAARSAFQLNIFYISFSYAFAPQIVAESLDQELSARRNSRRSSLLFWLAAPVYLGAMGFGKYVMLLFGPEFLPALGVFLIIAMSGYINLLLGPSEVYLRMCGFQRVEAGSMLVSLVVTLGMDMLLIPKIGIYGAAVGAASGFAAFKLLSTFYAAKVGFIQMPKKTLLRVFYAVPPLWGALTQDNPVTLAAMVVLPIAIMFVVERAPAKDLVEAVKGIASRPASLRAQE